MSGHERTMTRKRFQHQLPLWGSPLWFTVKRWCQKTPSYRDSRIVYITDILHIFVAKMRTYFTPWNRLLVLKGSETWQQSRRSLNSYYIYFNCHAWTYFTMPTWQAVSSTAKWYHLQFHSIFTSNPIDYKTHYLLLKDLSMIYRALWDRRHEGATRISQCTRRVAPSALTYPSGQAIFRQKLYFHILLICICSVTLCCRCIVKLAKHRMKAHLPRIDK